MTDLSHLDSATPTSEPCEVLECPSPRKGPQWIGLWAGGRIRQSQCGPVHVIERMGRTVALRGVPENQVGAELSRFLEAPASYVPPHKRKLAAVAADIGPASLTPVVLSEFIQAKRTEGASDVHVRDLFRYCKAWGVALKGRDLRHVRLAELVTMLDKWGNARSHRTTAIKSLTRWMERTGRLEPRDNPSRGLSVPQYAAEKTKRENRAKGYGREHVAAIYSEVGSQTVRDILYLRAMTGMHGTEIQRIGQGKALLRRIDDASGIVATLTFPHKRGSDHTISLDERAYAVVMRIQATGTVSTTAIHNAVKVAVKRLAKRGIEVEKINPNELRHSFVTWATSMGHLVRPSTGGLSLDDVAAVTGHLSTTTTRRHYLGSHVPPMIKIPLVLAHRDDPEAPTA